MELTLKNMTRNTEAGGRSVEEELKRCNGLLSLLSIMRGETEEGEEQKDKSCDEMLSALQRVTRDLKTESEEVEEDGFCYDDILSSIETMKKTEQSWKVKEDNLKRRAIPYQRLLIGSENDDDGQHRITSGSLPDEPDYPESELNLDFIKTLRSMAEVEKDPDFRSKEYVIVDEEGKVVPMISIDMISAPSDDYADLHNDDPSSVVIIGDNNNHNDPASGAVPVVLKHPKNVVLVGETAPLPGPNQIRVLELSKAIRTACGLSHHGRDGVSIVVYDGLYIDPTAKFGEEGMHELNWHKGFSLEIVGMGQVRILMLHWKVRYLFAAVDFDLTLKNLLIYDRQTSVNTVNHIEVYAVWAKRARVELVDVRMHGSRIYPIHSSEEGTWCMIYSIVRLTAICK